MNFARMLRKAVAISPAAIIVIACLIALLGSTVRAAVTPEQAQKLQQAISLLTAADTQFRAKEFDKLGQTLEAAQKLLAELEKVPELAARVAGLNRRLTLARNRLDTAMPSEAGDAADGALPTRNISFIKHVAPVLVAKCGQCHVRDRKGDFNMANFDLLARGAGGAAVILPGKGSGSRLVEVIESGDMPRGNVGEVTKEELAAITKWIDEGAKFDGRSTSTPLVRLISSTPGAPSMAEPTELTVVPATGSETVSYSRDIAPVLLSACVECHTASRQSGGLCLDNFQLVLKGGESGAMLAPGEPADSLLIKKLKGMAGQRMPLNRDPLPGNVIAKFEKWIEEGAKFDGGDPSLSTPIMIRNFRVRTLSHEQLAKDRIESSQQKWRLTSPTGQPAVKETKNFLLIGRTSEIVLDEVEKVAEAQATAVRRIFRAPANQPLIKGRMTLFVFPGRYDYSEFGRMVEQRQLPADWRGHFGIDTEDIFGAVVLPDAAGGSDYSLEGIVGQQIASAYVASLSNTPTWFAEGCGHVYAARIDVKANRVKQWNERLAEIATTDRAPRLFDRGLSPEEGEAVAYGFVRALMNNTGKFNSLMAALRKGEDFDQAFTRNFGPPKEALARVVYGR